MKRLVALAAFLLAGSAAHAQYTFDYGGRTIHIDPDRGTVSIPGVYDNTGRRKRSHNERGSERPRKPAPEQAKVEPQPPAPTPSQNDRSPAAAIAPTTTSVEPSGATANVAPAATPDSPQLPAIAPNPSPAPVIATAPPAVPLQTPQAAPHLNVGDHAARAVAYSREGRQGPDRAMRRQSLRIFRGSQIKPERRAGPDQHEAWQRRQMERADSRPQHWQHLRFDDRAARIGHPANSGLHHGRYVLRRTDLEPAELTRNLLHPRGMIACRKSYRDLRVSLPTST